MLALVAFDLNTSFPEGLHEVVFDDLKLEPLVQLCKWPMGRNKISFDILSKVQLNMVKEYNTLIVRDWK